MNESIDQIIHRQVHNEEILNTEPVQRMDSISKSQLIESVSNSLIGKGSRRD